MHSETNTGFLSLLIATCYHAQSNNSLDLICVCEFNVNLWKIKAMFCSLGWKIHHNPPALTFNNAGVKFSGADGNIF